MNRKEILFGLLAAVFLALVLSPFASSSPDGLERVAEDKGFLESAEAESVIPAPFPDYVWPGINSERLATSAAGFFGTLFVFGCTYALALVIRK